MLRVGIIGCGGIAPKHIEAYQRCGQTEIKAVASAGEQNAKRTGEKLGVPWYTDYRKMLDRGDIDLVSICTPNGFHMEPALEAARRKIHVVLEKPLEITTERVDRIIEAGEKNGVAISCIFNHRFSNAHAFLKEAVDQGRFGRLINVNVATRWYRAPKYYSDSPWHGTLALDGGGALMNQGIHYIDLLQWLSGPVESVFAYTGTLLHTSIEAEDTAVACLRFQNGALGTVIGTTSTYPGYPAELQLTGERGSAVITKGAITSWSFIDTDPIDEKAHILMEQGNSGNHAVGNPVAFPGKDHYRQIARIAEAIEAGKPLDVSAREARKAVAIIEAIYRSSKSHQEEPVQ